MVKVNPIAPWTEDDVRQYEADRDLPRHPLHDRGYGSIGCWPCTRQVAPRRRPSIGPLGRYRQAGVRPARLTLHSVFGTLREQYVLRACRKAEVWQHLPMQRSLRTRVAIASGRAAGWLSRVMTRGQGATISGRVINAISPHALEELAEGQRVTLVSATNGKTTTTRLLAAALEADGRHVTSNSTGANLTSGIAPTLAGADGPGDAVLEVDERVVPRVVDPLDAQLLVLGNLSRDQLDRYGEVHLLADAWRTVAEEHPGLAIVANASDPHIVWAATPAKVTWVALGLGLARRRGDLPVVRRVVGLVRRPVRVHRLRIRPTGHSEPARRQRPRARRPPACRSGSRCRANGTSRTPRWR